jgi:hypothetical protein
MRPGSMVATFHSLAGVERRSQLPDEGVRAGIGTIVTEAQHVQVQLL